MKLGRIENKTLRQKIYELLKEKITTADILPGEKISLRGLASELGVSIIPVREALFQLESERVIVIVSNKHIRVSNLSAGEIQEILRIRLSLETMAAEMACDLRQESDLPRIESILLEMRATIKETKDYLKHNRCFHLEIYKLAESPILLDLIGNLWARIGPYIYLHTFERRDLTVPMEYHKNMYEALVDRDKSKMVNALHRDLNEAAADIIRYIESKFSPTRQLNVPNVSLQNIEE
jgi:DNA-binding GntR family transcriptional regulator